METELTADYLAFTCQWDRYTSKWACSLLVEKDYCGAHSWNGTMQHLPFFGFFTLYLWCTSSSQSFLQDQTINTQVQQTAMQNVRMAPTVLVPTGKIKVWLLRQLNCCIFLWSFKNHSEVKKCFSPPARSDSEILMNLPKSNIPVNCFVATWFYFKTFCLSLSNNQQGFMYIFKGCPIPSFARFQRYRQISNSMSLAMSITPASQFFPHHSRTN